MRQRLFLLTILLHALTYDTSATHTQEESNEDRQSSFNVVSTLRGGSESSRRHIQSRHELDPSQASDTVQAADNLIGASYGQSYAQQHYGHSHAAGAACTETRDHNSFAGTVGAHDIDEPHSHVRTGDSTSGAGLLDIRKSSPSGRTVPNRPFSYNGNAPTYAPSYPQPTYPPPSYLPPSAVGVPSGHLQPPPPQQQPGAYYHPTAGAYPHNPVPHDGLYRPPPPPQLAIVYQPHYTPHYYPHHNPHRDPPHNPHYPLHSHDHGFGRGHHRDSWNSHLQLQTEYKEDGVHTGPTHALTNNGYGFGSGFGAGYNGAYNRPGY